MIKRKTKARKHKSIINLYNIIGQGNEFSIFFYNLVIKKKSEIQVENYGSLHISLY